MIIFDSQHIKKIVKLNIEMSRLTFLKTKLIKSYIENVENHMWQKPVEMNEITIDKYWTI